MANLANDIAMKVYDWEFRNKIQQDSQLHAKDLLGESYDAGVKYSVSLSNKDTTYIAIPYIEDGAVLLDVAATGKASTTGTVGSVGSASTLGSACGTLSTASSGGSLGSVGSAKT